MFEEEEYLEDQDYFGGDDWVPGGCPACGNAIDYCQGHGTIGDPFGASILKAHDNDDHTLCHEQGCDAVLVGV